MDAFQKIAEVSEGSAPRSFLDDEINDVSADIFYGRKTETNTTSIDGKILKA